MAAKFVVAAACLALCSSSPVLLSGAVSRDGRAYSIGQAYNYGGGPSVASANVLGEQAQAYGSANGNQLARDGYVEQAPSGAIAQAYGSQENPAYGSKALAQAQNAAYYPIPAPARVITYQQNFAVPPEVAYPESVQAYSSAVRNGITDESTSSVTSNGNGIAESSANTGANGYSNTASNAKTSGINGHADSIAKSGYNTASTAARTQGQGSASSTANNNGVAGVAYPVAPVDPIAIPSQEYVPEVAELKTPVYKTYVPVAPASANSNAQVVGAGVASSSAKVNQGRTISWRFGTMYDAPGTAQAQATSHGSGIAKSQANTNGYGAANANADVNTNGYGNVKSNANTYGANTANADATVNGNGYGSAKSTANTHSGSASSIANSNTYGHAKSAANVHSGYYSGSRASADAQTQGQGSASSAARAQPVSTAFRVANTGYARANAQAA